MSAALKLAWLVLATLIACDAILCGLLGWTLTNWTAPAAPFGILAVVAVGYGWTGRSPGLANTAGWFLAWTVLSLSGVVLSYVGGASPRPRADGILTRLDLALGFDWQSWFVYVLDRPVLLSVLTLAYASMMPQIVLSVVYFSWRRADAKNAGLFLNCLVVTGVTIAVFAAFPALGPSYAVPLSDSACDSFLTELRDRNGIMELLALHNRTFKAIDLAHLKGLISFPSLHTAIAVMLTHIHFGSRLFVPALILNGLMVLSVPVIGGHYLVDVVAGALLAGATIRLTWPLRRRLADTGTVARG